MRLVQGPLRSELAGDSRAALYDLVSHPDPACATAATQAMYGMSKIVIADLEKAVASV